MTTGREAHDGAPAAACGGDAPAPPTAAAAAGVVIEVRSAESECSGGELKDCREEGGKVGGEQEGKGETGVSGTEKAAVVVVDVSAAGGGGWNAEAEKVCRICHLSPDREDLEGSELIQIGCRCKGELGTAHRRCAEAWFKVKGNRCCEICGAYAKNIIGEEDNSFMETWHERRMLGNNSNRSSSESSSCLRGQPFCNFLMACLVIAFILPWFFRVNIF
ncbi:E3 ubiquitin-protein ligase MARCHF11-like isoform X1 [Phoenix dactylifera]|uniref:E3 ubiquitin-protein ligase MARCHF11-like isoform X1 n=1 Tax=Phoenix dactylifera TaxID=42345 RepID=A0A8B7BYK5_PHODC|nr:E3 ubiquitin-protein ligase MARCHF11-like isoform X1 [Phoenix dactylifera]